MSAFIVWSETLELGIPSIDEQHRELVDLLSRLATVSAPGTGGDIHDDQLELLGHIYQHTRVHFRHEEELMEEVGFADLPTHRAEHQMLLAELRSFVHQVESGNTVIDAKSISSLRDWLLVHIASSDRPFANVYLEAMALEEEVTSS